MQVCLKYSKVYLKCPSKQAVSISLTDGGVGTRLFNSNTPFEVTANGKSKRKIFLTINRKKEKGKKKKKKKERKTKTGLAYTNQNLNISLRLLRSLLLFSLGTSFTQLIMC